MRWVGLWASAMFAGSLLGCGSSPSENPAAAEVDDRRALQGTWRMVSCIADGESQTANLEWIVDGDHYTIRLDGKPHNDPYFFSVDPKRKRIDVHHHDTPKGTYGGHLKGIYSIQENGFKVCYDLKGENYPDSFEAERGSARASYQFQRQ